MPQNTGKGWRGISESDLNRLQSRIRDSVTVVKGGVAKDPEKRAVGDSRQSSKVLKWVVYFPDWPFIPEFRFCERRWKFDLALPDRKIAIEINGGIFAYQPSHHSIKGILRDMEKLNEAQILGWKVLQFTPEQVKDGSARLTLERLLK